MDSNDQLITHSGGDWSWRMIHDGTQVMNVPFYACGVTGTINTLFEADTLDDCMAEIERLNLTYSFEPKEVLARTIFPDEK